MIGGCLGHSDHEIVGFKVLGVMRKKFTKVPTLYFKSTDFKILQGVSRGSQRESLSH